jgi:hypothetical protein
MPDILNIYNDAGQKKGQGSTSAEESGIMWGIEIKINQ